MTQVWSDDGTGRCQFCGQHVDCLGTWLDERFRKEHENYEWQARHCSGCGRFRITGSAGWYSEIPEKTLQAVSSWIKDNQSGVPASGWDYTDFPLVTSGLLDYLRESSVSSDVADQHIGVAVRDRDRPTSPALQIPGDAGPSYEPGSAERTVGQEAKPPYRNSLIGSPIVTTMPW